MLISLLTSFESRLMCADCLVFQAEAQTKQAGLEAPIAAAVVQALKGRQDELTAGM